MNTLSVIISILGIIGLEISPIPFNPLKLLGKGVSYYRNREKDRQTRKNC